MFIQIVNDNLTGWNLIWILIALHYNNAQEIGIQVTLDEHTETIELCNTKTNVS